MHTKLTYQFDSLWLLRNLIKLFFFPAWSSALTRMCFTGPKKQFPCHDLWQKKVFYEQNKTIQSNNNCSFIRPDRELFKFRYSTPTQGEAVAMPLVQYPQCLESLAYSFVFIQQEYGCASTFLASAIRAGVCHMYTGL